MPMRSGTTPSSSRRYVITRRQSRIWRQGSMSLRGHPSAEAEAAVVMHDHQETCSGETLRIRNESLMFDGSEPVRHADCGYGCATAPLGTINPCVQTDPALRGYPVLFWLLGHDRLLSCLPGDPS